VAGTTKNEPKMQANLTSRNIRFPLYVAVVVIRMVWYLFCCIVITHQATNYTLIARRIKLLQFLEN